MRVVIGDKVSAAPVHSQLDRQMKSPRREDRT